MYWTIPESCMAVVCACLPTLRPLFHGWSPESLIGSVRSAVSLHSSEGRSEKTLPRSVGERQKGFHVEQSSDNVRELDEKGFDAVELPPFLTNVTHDDWCNAESVGGRTSEDIISGCTLNDRP
jgi:hypothetical protein